MSNKKWDSENVKDVSIVVLGNKSLSGSSVTTKEIDVKKTQNINPKLDLKFEKVNKIKESLIVPIEEWPSKMTKSELVAYKEYKRQEFPELFEIKGLDNDKSSEVPFLALIRPARIFATLLQTSVRKQLEKNKNKITN